MGNHRWLNESFPPAMRKLLTPVNLARLLLVALPCVPGLIFLLAGFVCDPLWRTQGAAGEPNPPARVRAVLQAHALYLAGAVTLFGGTLGMGAVLWKIARTHPEANDAPPVAEAGP